uniref:Uncharacterized protein n=1 Tax=Anopheles darlingi TaxID=43151 RepID=A0A2M4DB17_ANODA
MIFLQTCSTIMVSTSLIEVGVAVGRVPLASLRAVVSFTPCRKFICGRLAFAPLDGVWIGFRFVAIYVSFLYCSSPLVSKSLVV